MSDRALILLSPYRLPTHTTLYLADDDVAAFLNAASVLWHPAALNRAIGPPRIDSPYDHDRPVDGQIFAVPEHPPLGLPDDWDSRVSAAGAIVFKTTASRIESLARLKAALEPAADSTTKMLLELPAERIAPFLALGFGYVQLHGLFEAMSHDNVLSKDDFWNDVSQAVAALTGDDPGAAGRHLQAAAQRLLEAREIVSSSPLHLIDLCLLDEQKPETEWPQGLRLGHSLNVIACAERLARLARDRPEHFAILRERLAGEQAELCGGPYQERDDALLPLESQIWNIQKGQRVYKELLGKEVAVFARHKFGSHPQLPMLLQNLGISRAVLLAFDDSMLPTHRGAVISWCSLDGKQIEAFARIPLAADSPQTYFHLPYHLYQTLMHDSSASLALLHREKEPAPWYADWQELNRLAPVLGVWSTLSNYLSSVSPQDYPSPATADEFHSEYLLTRVAAAEAGGPRDVVSGFAVQQRARRKLDTLFTLSALSRGLGGPPAEGVPADAELVRLEDCVESAVVIDQEELNGALEKTAAALSHRLVARGPAHDGFLVLNPCSFKRRIALELPDLKAAIPTGGAVKASQLNGTTGLVVVEVPALGFAWFPKTGGPAAPPALGRMKLADERSVRNEFFEAEIDPSTGGLKAIRDHRTRVNRIGQQLIFNPGSTARMRKSTVNSVGPALGEIVTEGVLVDTHDEELATFRQRFRAWIGRPILEMRIELTPTRQPEGYPWHSFYGARFAWRDPTAPMLRGGNGTVELTGVTRPETGDFLELRQGSQNTIILPGGLPFHQRQGNRMVDVILIPAGEAATTFDLAIGLDRDVPMQTALGLTTPAPVTATVQGPPHVGDTGWLFHLDATNVLLLSLRPGEGESIIARMLECSGNSGPAELRCPRNPKRTMLVDCRGQTLVDLSTSGDAVLLDVNHHDLMQVRVEFG